jgi:hypothetical protein
MQTETLKDYLSRTELAVEFGVSTKTLVRWEKDEGLPVTFLGRDPLYYKPSIQRWLRAREKNGKQTGRPHR